MHCVSFLCYVFWYTAETGQTRQGGPESSPRQDVFLQGIRHLDVHYSPKILKVGFNDTSIND